LGPERFHQEIKIAANLHHPHILPLHDSGEADGFLYYVMPYEEGQSLRDKLAKEGELPITEAVRILRDVVDALDHAHKHGVVHRDIKPDNVLLSERHALVTDPGVAKAVSEATGRQKRTTEGVALGTPAYMAPEQAAADKHIDHRADIYAIGVVAYELLTGRIPFLGTTPQMILSAHMTDTPEPVTKYRESVPPALEQLVMKCLEKKAADRWQSAEELLPQLEALATPSGGVTPTGTVPVDRVAKRRSMNLAVATGVAVAVTVLGFLAWVSLRHTETQITLSNIRQITRAPEIEVEPAISPAGSEVVYSAGTGMEMHLYVQDLAGGRPISLTDERVGSQVFPSWSPDGSNIVFIDFPSVASTGASHVIPRFGGTTRMIAEGLVWSVNEDRVVYSRDGGILVRALNGGEPRLVLRDSLAHSVDWSPDGSMLAYVQGNQMYIGFGGALGNVSPSSIWTVSADGGTPVRVTDSLSLNMSPAWLPGGRHLLLVSDRDGPRDVYMVRVDELGRRHGEPIRITTGLDPHSISVSADGATLAYSQFTYRRNVWEITIPTAGSVSISEARSVTVGNQTVENHGVSRDGRWLAYDSNLEGNQDVYVVPIEGGEPRRVTTDPGDDFHPDLSPDGREIVFYSTRHGTRDLFLISVDGGSETRLTNGPGDEMHPAFSPDGLRIAYMAGGHLSEAVYIISRDSVGGEWSTAQQLTGSGGGYPRWSPDGSQVVYHAEQPSRGIDVVTLDGEIRRLVDGHEVGLPSLSVPEWSPDGRSILFFLGTDRGRSALYAVPTAGGPVRPVIHFDDPTKTVGYTFSVSDGKVYLTVSEIESDIYVMDVEVER
jgi:serine/threonine-protein kinase